MIEKEIIGGASIAVGIASYALYLYGIHRDQIKPHVFTWIIWALTMAIGFAAQYSEDAGPGAWALGFGAIVTFMIGVIGFFYGEKNITRKDWIAFIAALSAIPVWALTQNPLWAVIIVVSIDAVAYYPTFRKSWGKPYEEGAAVFFLGGIQFALAMLALEKMTMTTALYPFVISFLNFALAFMLIYRRRHIT